MAKTPKKSQRKTTKKTAKKTKTKKKPSIKSITVAISGANTIEIDNHIGRPIGEVQEALTVIANIAADAVPMIGGKEVKKSQIIKQGDKVEFVKESGEKGC